MSAPYNNPTEGQIIADIVAAADYVFGIKLNRGATIREIGAQAFDHVLPKSLAAAAEPFRADWVAAHAILAQPAPKTFDELRAAMTTVAPVYPNLHGVIGPMPANLARKIEDWYLAEITRAVDRAGILMAEREAARATIERINREFTAAADAQKWIVNGEEVSGADIELN